MIYPEEGWRQRGDTDLQGLWSSFNLDLANKNKKGKLLVSPRLLLNTDSTVSNFGNPTAIKYMGGVGWIAICGARVFSNSATDRSPFDSFVEMTNPAGAPTNCDANSDLEIMPENDDIYVTTNSTSTYKFDGTTWTNFTAGTGSFVKKLAYFRPQARMYMTYGVGNVTSWTTTDTAATLGQQYTLTLGDSYQNYITSLVPSTDYLWVLTLNLTSGLSRQFRWDGSQASGPNSYVDLDANGALAGGIKDGVLWIVDTEGRLMQNNGMTFTEKARFPFGGKMPKNSLSTSNVGASARWIHPNSMGLIDGKWNFLINNPFEDGTEESERCPAGIWEFDEATGSLFHKQSISYHAKTAGSVTDYGQMRLSIPGALIGAKHSSTDNGNILAGATYYSDATTTKSGIFINDSADTLAKYGSFVTEWLKTANIKEAWHNIYARIRKHLNSGDKIIVKYRTNEDVSAQFTGTWVDTSSFTTATDLTNYIGAEVEVLNGTGGGKTAHILSCTQGVSWTIVLDDTFLGVTTGTFKGRVQTWKKCQAEFNDQVETTPSFAFVDAQASPVIQIKVCLQWTGKNELFDFILNSAKAQ